MNKHSYRPIYCIIILKVTTLHIGPCQVNQNGVDCGTWVLETTNNSGSTITLYYNYTSHDVCMRVELETMAKPKGT